MSGPPHHLTPCPSIPITAEPSFRLPEGLETFTFGRFRFDFVTEQPLSLPRYKGAVFRGGFGSHLKKISCSPGRSDPCGSCILSADCAYARVFETPVRPEDTGLVEGMSDAPHPMVLRPPFSSKRRFRAGEPFDLELILVGEGMRFVPQIVCAFDDFSREGIGREKTSFTMVGVSALVADTWKRIYSPEEQKLHQYPWSQTGLDLLPPAEQCQGDRMELRLETPLRIKSEGSITDDLTFELLTKNVLRRLGILDTLHCQRGIQLDHERLIALSAHVATVSERLWWTEWTHFSRRRQASVTMGGLVGEITFQGDLSEFVPYFRLGEILHAGKGTAYGMGRYSLRILNGEDTDRRH